MKPDTTMLLQRAAASRKAVRWLAVTGVRNTTSTLYVLGTAVPSVTKSKNTDPLLGSVAVVMYPLIVPPTVRVAEVRPTASVTVAPTEPDPPPEIDQLTVVPATGLP